MKPLLSVVVPVYNVSRFLPRVVDSLKNQSADRSLWEAVFVDDASSDGSLETLYALTSGQKNMKVISHDRNRGTAVTRNTGVGYSGGKFIANLDGDDMLEPLALDVVAGFLEENPDVGYFYSSHKRVDEEGNLLQERLSRPFNKQDLSHFNFISHLKGYSRRVHDAIGGFRGEYAEDWDHPLRTLEILSPEQFGRIPDFLYLYTMRKGSTIHATPEEKKQRDVCEFLKPHILSRVGHDVEVFWSHLTDDGFNYYDWRRK